MCGLSAVIWDYDCSETCCVDSMQTFDIMTVLRPVVWNQCSHLTLWLFWDLLCGLSAVICIMTVLRPVVWNQCSHLTLWLFWDLLCGLSTVICIMTVLRPVVWNQCSHLTLWLFWDLLYGLSAVLGNRNCSPPLSSHVVGEGAGLM
jgi:hypothetical protein